VLVRAQLRRRWCLDSPYRISGILSLNIFLWRFSLKRSLPTYTYGLKISSHTHHQKCSPGFRSFPRSGACKFTNQSTGFKMEKVEKNK
jgi:hypothetical protein